MFLHSAILKFYFGGYYLAIKGSLIKEELKETMDEAIQQACDREYPEAAWFNRGFFFDS